MEIHTSRLDDGLTLQIPYDFACELGLGPDSSVDLSILGKSIVICPTQQLRVRLDELLAGVTEDNIHNEVRTGPVVGREIW